jgi:hypothetical protein
MVRNNARERSISDHRFVFSISRFLPLVININQLLGTKCASRTNVVEFSQAASFGVLRQSYIHIDTNEKKSLGALPCQSQSMTITAKKESSSSKRYRE